MTTQILTPATLIGAQISTAWAKPFFRCNGLDWTDFCKNGIAWSRVKPLINCGDYISRIESSLDREGINNGEA